MALASTLSSISFNGTTIGAVGTATVSLSRPALDVTGIGATNSSFVTGVQSATATLDIFYDQADSTHAALETNINGNGAPVATVLTMASGMTYSGNATVTSFEVTAQVGSAVRASVTLQYTGAITIA
jgi:predicted secreted protein